jgi:hypothetical protein
MIQSELRFSARKASVTRRAVGGEFCVTHEGLYVQVGAPAIIMMIQSELYLCVCLLLQYLL